MLEFTLSFEGKSADEHTLDFYDAAQAMIGFQRSLALTTHLVLNGEVITQSPSLKNAQIFVKPPEEGSWKVTARLMVLGTALYHLGTMPQNTPFGHVMYSAYDYVISESLGFHVDYEQSLGEKYEKLHAHKDNKFPILQQSQFDSVIEKSENAVREMHRPIVKSKTAEEALILASDGGGRAKPLGSKLDFGSYEYVIHTEQTTEIEDFAGRISSYNINAFKGRIFIGDFKRSVPFTLSENARTASNINKITRSLHANASDRFKKGEDNGQIWVKALRNESRNSRLKSLFVVGISS